MAVKQSNKPLEFNYSNEIKVTFTDVIRVHMNLETVTLELALKDTLEEKATVTEKVIMTIPHFLRFLDVAQKTSDDMLKHMENLRKQQIKQK